MENYRPARLIHRTLAYIADSAIWTALWLIVLAYQGIFAKIHHAFKMQTVLSVKIPWTMFSLHLILTLIYLLILRYYGTSPGKALFGIKVISRKNDCLTLNWKSTFIRFIITNFVARFIINIPEAIAFFTRDRLQLADILAKSQVVQLGDQDINLKPRFLIGSLLILLGISSTIKKFNKMPVTADGYKLVQDFRSTKETA